MRELLDELVALPVARVLRLRKGFAFARHLRRSA
jgi:hypothetical protein